jgi:NADH:ubiquinone oxidoreductase subunit 4 (subunit M)
MSWPILSVTTFLPLVGALLIMALPGEGKAEQRNSRWIALWTTLISAALLRPDLFEFQLWRPAHFGGALPLYVDGIAAFVVSPPA